MQLSAVPDFSSLPRLAKILFQFYRPVLMHLFNAKLDVTGFAFTVLLVLTPNLLNLRFFWANVLVAASRKRFSVV